MKSLVPCEKTRYQSSPDLGHLQAGDEGETVRQDL